MDEKKAEKQKAYHRGHEKRQGSSRERVLGTHLGRLGSVQVGLVVKVLLQADPNALL